MTDILERMKEICKEVDERIEEEYKKMFPSGPTTITYAEMFRAIEVEKQKLIAKDGHSFLKDHIRIFNGI